MLTSPRSLTLSLLPCVRVVLRNTWKHPVKAQWGAESQVNCAAFRPGFRVVELFRLSLRFTKNVAAKITPFFTTFGSTR